MAPSRIELRSRSRQCLVDAERLYAATSYWGSFYLAGYALEFALKARICRHLGVLSYPTINQFKVHDLSTLSLLAGIQPALDTNATLKANWSIAARWSVEIRYDFGISLLQADARDMLDALRAPPDGLFDMATATLVDDWVSAIDGLESRVGSIPFAVLLPVSEEQAVDVGRERFTLFLSAPWTLGVAPQTALVKIVQSLQSFPEANLTLENVTLVDRDDPLVDGILLSYSGRVSRLPAPIYDYTIAGRFARGGWILRASDFPSARIDVHRRSDSQDTITQVSLKPRWGHLFDDNDLVRKSAVSPRKVDEFFSRLRKDRSAAGTLEALLADAGMRQISHGALEEQWRGFTILVNKGPFVDGANWFNLASWELALALERDVARQARHTLQENSAEIRANRESWTDIRQAIARAVSRLGDPEHVLFLFDGRPAIDVSRDISLQSDHRVYSQLRRFGVLGEAFGHPIARLSLEESASRVHVIDMSRGLKCIRSVGPGNAEFVEAALGPLEQNLVEAKVRDESFWKFAPELDRHWRLRFFEERLVLRVYEAVRIEVSDAGGWISVGLQSS